MLGPHVPDLGALEVLAAVARTGSLNAAARELGRTQQAVSARVASMEAQTGVALVRRSPQGSRLTADGVVVAEWAARLLDAAAEFEAGLTALRRDRRARLRVAASLTVAERLLPGWLVRFRATSRTVAADPDLAVTLTAVNSGAVAELVRGGEVDIGFVEGPRAPRGCRSRVVGHDRLVVVAARGHPWAARTAPLSATELARTPLVARESGSGTRDAFVVALRAVRDDLEPVTPVLELSTTAAVRAAVLAGAGPAVLSELVVGDDLAAGRLVAVPVSRALDLGRDLRAVWVGGRTPPPGPVRELVELTGAGRG